jgi:pimeloyl-ACP methyl ester carboxylesterase
MKPMSLVLGALLLAGCATQGGLGTAGFGGGGLECRGAKSARPTVILEAGAFGGAADWSLVADDLAAKGKVCAYDRDGVALAAIHDVDRSPVAIATRLEALVAAEEGDAPVILAGHSNGGLYVEAFARMWPARTAGLVLVDAVGTDAKDQPLAMADLKREARLAGFTPFARVVGLTRLVPLLDDISPAAEAAARRRRAWTGRNSIRASLREERAFLPGFAAVDALPPLSPAIPLAVIVASRTPDRPLDRAWRAAEAAPAGRACRALVIDAFATHTSILDAQRGHVVEAVDWISGRRPGTNARPC